MEKKNKNQEKQTSLQTISNIVDDSINIQMEIENKTKELQKKLEELEVKKRLSTHRTLFINVLDNLNDAADKIADEQTFDSELYKLKFVTFAGYRDDEVFTIGNRSLIAEFIEFIKIKIADKIKSLEEELIA